MLSVQCLLISSKDRNGQPLIYLWPESHGLSVPPGSHFLAKLDRNSIQHGK